MTDVRLTATNPDDSTVVPVACNKRGELLIEDPKIEKIDNNVTIDGILRVDPPADSATPNASFYAVRNPTGTRYGELYDGGSQQVRLTAGGYVKEDNTWVNTVGGGTGGASEIRLETAAGRITFHAENNLSTGGSGFLPERFRVDTNGPSSFDLTLTRGQDARSWKSQISVFEELLFLREQLRAAMEKLRLTPEGGWEVWDGSD